MISWVSSEDEKKARKIDFENLSKVISFVKGCNSDDAMVRYVCQIFDEYKSLIIDDPYLLRDVLQMTFDSDFAKDADVEKADIIISPSDLNAYYTIKKLNSERKSLAVVCFDLHSDTYDYNDFLWKGNSFSKLMREGYISHYIVLGVPKQKRSAVLEDTNVELRDRVHLIDEDMLFQTINLTGCSHMFVSIDADCFNCREAKYTAVEYSPSTILNYVSYIRDINVENFKERIHDCVHVQNELGYSNYYHTGENDLTVEKVIEIIDSVVHYCSLNGIKVGLTDDGPYFQIMEVSGYDYGSLTSEMVIKLIKGLVKKEVRKDDKIRVFEKS